MQRQGRVNAQMIGWYVLSHVYSATDDDCCRLDRSYAEVGLELATNLQMVCFAVEKSLHFTEIPIRLV